MNAITTLSKAMKLLDEIRSALAESTDFDQICDLQNQAELIRNYLKAAALGLEFQNKAAEMKLVCQRRLGDILSERIRQGGDHKSQDRYQEATLEDLGISPSDSSRWQREASVSEEDFARYVEQTNKEGRELTSNGLLRLARICADAAKPVANGKDPLGRLASGLKSLACQQKRFACVYAEPPWSVGDSKAEIARLPKSLCRLPVKLVVAQQAHLHLWVPPEMLDVGLAALRAWGFVYKSVLVRTRAPLDYGDYWRHAHDMLLLGVRGRMPFHDSGLPSWMDGQDLSARDRAAEIQALIARASPSPCLDLFGTTGAKGWTTP